ncbi:HNH endonuclease [Planomonospora sp. ID82291]|uniref:HNH endonuclease n=1 Tax=Planomonospora sp. ID82291 TaxID=2738136 RepID=UPI0018C44D58|nr:HNH endonuclease [Planomonospora sp. ID82291]MBG0818990.1 HNH endonuclease [Planomonospora sp. ID82291]
MTVLAWPPLAVPGLGARWLKRVDMAGPVPEHAPELGPCWPTSGPTNNKGYPIISVGGKTKLLHLVVYPLVHGPIPPGWEVDHLCHHPDYCRLKVSCPHRRCGNPGHWLARTPEENNLRSGSPTAVNARKEECIRGHELVGTNLATRKDRPDHRECKACRRLRRSMALAVEIATAGGAGEQLGLL